MASRKNRGGFLKQVFVFIFIGSVIFWFMKTPATGPVNSAEYWQTKSAATQAWAQSVAQGDLSRIWKGASGLIGSINGKEITFGSGSDSGSSSGSASHQASAANISKAKSEVDSLKTGGASVAYDRSEWKHWIAAGSSCWNVREEVLSRDAVSGSVVYLDKSGKETKSKSQACSIKSGKWEEPYTGKTVTDPKKLDIDHMIPLSYAAQHGGQAWSASKKESYANYLNNSYHLVASDAGANRTKGDKGPSQWMPSNKAYQCTYATNWVLIATQWNLSVDPADQKKLKSVLASCK